MGADDPVDRGQASRAHIPSQKSHRSSRNASCPRVILPLAERLSACERVVFSRASWRSGLAGCKPRNWPAGTASTVVRNWTLARSKHRLRQRYRPLLPGTESNVGAPIRIVRQCPDHLQGCGLVSNSRSAPRSQFSTSEAVTDSLPLRSAHSQMTATRHPTFMRSLRFRPSLATFSANLDCQNFARVAGVVAYRQRACLCQKQP